MKHSLGPWLRLVSTRTTPKLGDGKGRCTLTACPWHDTSAPMKSKLLGTPLGLLIDDNVWKKLSAASPLLILGLLVDGGLIAYGVYLQRKP